MIVEGSNVDGVTIRLCPSSAARTDAAIRAGYVFNNDRLPKPFSHPFCEDSSGHVGCAARTEGYDHGDGARRIGLRARVARNGRERGGTQRQAQKLTARVLTRGTSFRVRPVAYARPGETLRRWRRGRAERSLHDALHKSACSADYSALIF